MARKDTESREPIKKQNSEWLANKKKEWESRKMNKSRIQMLKNWAVSVESSGTIYFSVLTYDTNFCSEFYRSTQS